MPRPDPTSPETIVVDRVAVHFKAAIEASDLNPIKKIALRLIARIAIRWVLQLLVIMYAPMLLPILDVLLPLFASKLSIQTRNEMEFLRDLLAGGQVGIDPAIMAVMADVPLRLSGSVWAATPNLPTAG